jgi:hypothetical protein
VIVTPAPNELPKLVSLLYPYLKVLLGGFSRMLDVLRYKLNDPEMLEEVELK